MRICILNLTSGGLSGGYRKYLRRLVPLLQADSRMSHVDVMLPDAARADMADLEADLFFWPREDWKRNYSAVRQRVEESPPDVVFIPTARWLNLPVPSVVMVRNMETLPRPTWQNPLRERVRNVFRRCSARRACRHADRIIAVSQYVEQFLQTQWGISPERIGRVYHGVDALPEPRQPERLLNLRRPFLFTAGSIRPARGLEDLLHALPRMTHLPAAYALVIAGQTDPRMQGYRNRLDRLIEKHNLHDRVIWAGKLSPAEMAWCYGHCNWFVMTSRAEACPNTALEAMAGGCAILSTDQPPMPEFFCTSAMYYAARSPASLARQLQAALDLPESGRGDLQSAARARSEAFSWTHTARRTVDELQLACPSGQGNQ